MDERLLEYQQYVALDRQVRAMEQAQQQQAAAAQNWDAYQFTIAPTCPPSTSVWVRGGRRGTVAGSGGENTYTLTSSLSFGVDGRVYSGWPYACVNAGWYVPVYLCLLSLATTTGYIETPWFTLFGANYVSYWGGGFAEYETTGEAEAAIDATNADFSQDHLNEVGTPLGRIILRVEGPGYCNFMRVDKVNRGRSYLWGQFRNGRYMV